MISKNPFLTDTTTIEQAEKMGVAVSMEGRWRALEREGILVSELNSIINIHKNRDGEIVIPSWDLHRWNRSDLTLE